MKENTKLYAGHDVLTQHANNMQTIYAMCNKNFADKLQPLHDTLRHDITSNVCVLLSSN